MSVEWSLQLSVLPHKYQRKKTRVVQIHIYTAPEYFHLSKNLLFTESWLYLNYIFLNIQSGIFPPSAHPIALWAHVNLQNLKHPIAKKFSGGGADPPYSWYFPFAFHKGGFLLLLSSTGSDRTIIPRVCTSLSLSSLFSRLKRYLVISEESENCRCSIPLFLIRYCYLTANCKFIK